MEADFLLVQKMKQGDDGAVEIFVKKYYPKILRYCRYHLPDSACAEDVTQESFEKFFRSLGGYRHYGKAGSYLYAIAANACRDQARKRRELTADMADEILVAAAGAADNTANAAVRLDVDAALLKLPEELRQVAVLFFCLDVKQREIAKILNIGLPLVKYRVKRSRELLAAALEKEGYR